MEKCWGVGRSECHKSSLCPQYQREWKEAMPLFCTRYSPNCWGWGEVQAVRASRYLCNVLLQWRANVNQYHMKEQHFCLFCSMVKCLQQVHSEKIASEPVNVKFRKAEQRRGLSPCRNGSFYFLERTTSKVLASECLDHFDCRIKHLLYKQTIWPYLISGLRSAF